MTTHIVIDHERFGSRIEFSSLDEANDAIRKCGGELADAYVHLYNSREVRDDRGEVVGYPIECGDES